MVLGWELQGSGGAGLGAEGQRRSLPPPQEECRKEARQLGPTSGCAHCVEVSLARHTGILGVPAVCHPHLEKLQRKMLSSVPLTTSSIQILPVPVETSGHDVLKDAGAQDRQGTALCPELCCQFSSRVAPLPSPLHQTNASSLGSVSGKQNNNNGQ